MAEEENEEEIEVIDVSLNEQEIDEVIAHLVELKEHKKNVQIPIASDLDLFVTYDSDKSADADDSDDGDDDDSDDDDENKAEESA